MTRTKLAERKLPDYTRGEEIFNMVSHIVGGAMGIVFLVLGVIFAAVRGHGATNIVCAVVFGLSMVLLYTMSAVYHGLSPRLKGKKVMQVLDHCAVFILISGSYTPLTICTLMSINPTAAWWTFGVVWAASILGIVANSIDVNKAMKFSMVCYLGLGWCIALSLPSLLRVLPPAGIALLVSGGVTYTLGAVLFGLGKKIRYMHSVFHIFTVIGSLLHGLLMIIFVL